MKFLFKPVDPKVCTHSLEKRGFVSVPLDYTNKASQKISIFYRLIPAYGSKADDETKPIIVVFNGGPGIPSSSYRPIDFNYGAWGAQKPGFFDRFLYLLKTHHILIADQRGTDGQSAPLNLTDPGLDGDEIARVFSSDFQARDYLAVIEHVIPKKQKFFIIAQSYGGMVGMQYVSLPEARIPEKIFFTCSALPYEDILDAHFSRREEQKKLNLELAKAHPIFKKKVLSVRAALKNNKIDPDNVHQLYSWLGKSEKGTWEQKFLDHLDLIIKMNSSELKKTFLSSGDQNILNYILSSSNFTPGYTDRTLAQMTAGKIPYETWMLDENWVLIQTGRDQPIANRVLTKLDSNPPAPTPFLSAAELKECLKRYRAVFVSADNDAYVPAEAYKRAYQKFWTEGVTTAAHLPGGHHSIFLEKGAELFKA